MAEPRIDHRIGLRVALALVLALAAGLVAAQSTDPPVPPGFVVDARPGARVRHVPADARLAAWAHEIVRRGRPIIAKRLDLPDLPAFHIVLAPGESAFRQAVVEMAGREPPTWALAIAIPGSDQVVVRADRVGAVGPDNLGATMLHEMAHLAVGRAIRTSGGRRLPRWFEEGVAEWVAGRDPGREERHRLRQAARSGRLPPLRTLDRAMPDHDHAAGIAYLATASYVRHLDATHGADALRRLLRETAIRGHEEAVRLVLGRSAADVEAAWRTSLTRPSALEEALDTLTALYTSGGIYAGMAVLAILAFARYLLRRRRLLRAMEAEEPPLRRPAGSPPNPIPGPGHGGSPTQGQGTCGGGPGPGLE